MSGERILVVEDDAPSRTLFRDILTFRGHDVVVAETVDEARALLRPLPALVLMDLQVPGGGGESLLRELRRDPELAALPVIVVTASAMKGDRERLLAAGFNGYMSKPIDTRTFGPTVEGFLERAAADVALRHGKAGEPS